MSLNFVLSLICGTAFGSASTLKVNQDFDSYPIACSMIRLGKINDDRAIDIYPGYSCTLYKDTSYIGSWVSIENISDQIASIRINRLNTSTIAIFNGSWYNVAAVNSGSYGQSIRVYHGSIHEGTH
ncbi:MAG: hypothetical protein EOP48_05530 [Sphingobacteriales bacterium]|nr:MAG: hypothetical protein EOP48_05530 [Sphingobacteriales bacterium]